MTLWADRWQADGCLEMCLTKLAELDLATITVLDMNDLFALPSSLDEKAVMEKVYLMCQSWLDEQFGDVYAVITDSELLQSFCALSFPAVHEWAASENLEVHVENDVAVLLAFWHAGEVGQQCSDDDLLQLGQELRVGHLTPNFRRLMLSELEWFKGHVAEVNLFASMWERGGVETIEAAKSVKDFPGFPVAWSSCERAGMFLGDISDEHATIRAYASEAVLSNMLQDDLSSSQKAFGRVTYWHGYFWRAFIELKEGVIGGYLQCASHGPIPAARFVEFDFKINESHELDGFLVKEEQENGIGLLTEIGSITSIAQLQPHFTNGGFEVRLELSNVD